MTYDASSRDAYRSALVALTSLSTVGAITACGWLAGVAARDHASQEQVKESARAVAQQQTQAEWQRAQDAWLAGQPKEQRVRTIWKKRREVTRVETRLVRSPVIGTGGSLRSSSGSVSGTASVTPSSGGGNAAGPVRASGGTSGGSGSHSAPASAPPKPPPAPAPSSGS